ncbi:UNVERIFIED_CONTAM: CRP-like cAMP-binding protein [Acetivibrio alkalicellulosi]
MKSIEIIKKNYLFKGIHVDNLKEILTCLNAKSSFYKQREFVLLTGQKISFIGIVVSGKVVVEKEDKDGNRIIISEIPPGEMFGEAFACAGIEKSSVSVQAVEDSEVLLINYKKIITTCSSACIFHTKLIENMLELLARKLLMQNQRMEFVSKRTIREKLLSFFENQKKLSNSDKFTIPYNREQLADFLFVDRSALSRELGKMRHEGLIKFDKNKFELMYV